VTCKSDSLQFFSLKPVNQHALNVNVISRILKSCETNEWLESLPARGQTIEDSSNSPKLRSLTLFML
jgi:hypothetical protein